MSSTEFLSTYTMQSTGPKTGLPVVTLRFGDADDLACPFVTEAGCRVYPARPASCRTYPLARGVSRDRQTGHLSEHWALIREPHCLGFDNGQPQTVDEWVNDQQIDTHNRINDMMLELISLKKRLRPGPLTPSDTQRVYTALYDLDAFYNDRYDGDDNMATGVDPFIDQRLTDQWGADEQAIADDLKLLRTAMRWVKENVFGISLDNTRK
jgi:Fe-S-cluster containining protein